MIYLLLFINFIQFETYQSYQLFISKTNSAHSQIKCTSFLTHEHSRYRLNYHTNFQSNIVTQSESNILYCPVTTKKTQLGATDSLPVTDDDDLSYQEDVKRTILAIIASIVFAGGIALTKGGNKK